MANPGSERSPQKDHRDLPVEHLRLDYLNPRLASGYGAKTKRGLLKILWTEMDVAEIALSIAANGYLPEERLLVYKPDEYKQEFIVVEGNRRLAAVLLLRSKALREDVGATDLPRLTNSQIKDLDELPVSVYPTRESLWKYTGFRHINGPKPWDAFSKAKYVAHVHENYNVPMSRIAETIGDRHDTVERLYRGYKILEQAESQCGFDIEDRVKSKFAFSHLYTAVSDGSFQRFLGIRPTTSLKKNPVPRRKLKHLCELMVWLYGRKSKDIDPVVRKQQPDLWTLQGVISSPTSLAALRSGLSLDTAFQISVGDERRFREALTRAKEELLQARGSVIGYQGEEDLWDIAQDVVTLSTAIRTDMQSKRQTSRRKVVSD